MATWDECFDLVDWDRLARETAKKDCAAYAETVRAWLATETDADQKRALEVLAAVLALHIAWNGNIEEPLSPFRLVMAFPREALTPLADRAKSLPDPVLRARILDAAWLHHRACPASSALLAVDAYLDVADAVHEPQHWAESFAHLQRAVRLGVSLGRNQAATTRALDKVLEMLRSNAPTEPLFFSLRATQLLLEHKHGDLGALGGIAEGIGQRVVAEGDGDRGRRYYEVAASCYRRAGDDDASTRCLEAVASSLELDASGSEPGRRVVLLQQAIGVFRRIGGRQSETERLRGSHQQAQTDLVGAIGGTTTTLDLTDVVGQAQQKVTGQAPMDALIALARIECPPSVEDLRRSVLTVMKDSVFAAFISREKLSKTGRVIHRDEGALAGDGEDALRARTYEHAVVRMQVAARGGIRPAAEVVLREHGFTSEDFYYLAVHSPFVPNGREGAFAKGLTAGLYGDDFTAAHLLIPQLENAIRVVLTSLGVVTSTLPSSGIQNELDLNALLDKPEAEQFFGPNMLFTLKALLTEKAGANVRNELAHGLIDDGAASDLFLYTWWVVLHIVLAAAMPKETDAC